MNIVEDFNDIFHFLYTKYFSKIIFNSIYLSNHKTYIFTNILEMIKFIEKTEGLKSIIKHRLKIII